jgi:uncharacterized protein YggU (UPF0235/DUF167 family)
MPGGRGREGQAPAGSSRRDPRSWGRVAGEPTAGASPDGRVHVARLAVRLTPRAAIDAVDGRGPDGELRVRVRSAPVEGAANQALLRLLASELGASRGAVRLVAGVSGRRKIVEIEGLTAEVLDVRWPR